ncbi:MAG: methyl-accepting chemotaxis protein [Candidatus Gastranaerophilales bacterium]|nr:methyl-accepting chemotaxis protein [Candidatus Gastranaerophilales bacterium]
MNGKKISLGKKIAIAMIIVSTILVIITTCFSVFELRQSMLKDANSKTSEILELANNVIKGYQAQVAQGSLTKEEAQKMALKDLTNFRYQGSNYVWVNDYNVRFLVHPINPIGSDGAIIKDPDGKPFFKDLTTMALANKHDYISYKWSKAGQSKSVFYPKTSTSLNIPEWKWVIATGVYVDEIDKTVIELTALIIFANLILLTVLIALSQILFVKKISTEMTNITADMENGAKQVAQASLSLEKSSENLAEGSNEQAASIQEIAATIEESASMITKNNENSNYAAVLVKQVTDKAKAGHDKMEQMMNAMEKINNSSNEISKIIKLIDEIAFQTNILALNAAVEAARAGDAGKGFAVVAEEVRNLAQRSTISAKDTTKLIDENISLSHEGSQLASEVYGAIDEIDNEINKVNGIVQEVSVSSQEQLLGVQQIQTAINQMEQVLQMNAQTADSNSEASQELAAQTHELNNQIDDLRDIIEGTK